MQAKIKTMQNEDNNLKLDLNGIAIGDTTEDKKQRKRFKIPILKETTKKDLKKSLLWSTTKRMLEK